MIEDEQLKPTLTLMEEGLVCRLKQLAGTLPVLVR